jgi:hypothetical protein
VRLDFVGESALAEGGRGATRGAPIAVRRMVKRLHAAWTDF